MKWYQKINPWRLIRKLAERIVELKDADREFLKAMQKSNDAVQKMAKILERYQPCRNCATVVNTAQKGPRRVINGPSDSPSGHYWVCATCFAARRHAYQEIKP